MTGLYDYDNVTKQECFVYIRKEWTKNTIYCSKVKRTR